MLHSRWARSSAVIFAALVVSFTGLATPATADPADVTANLVPHCTYTRLEITNGTGAEIEAQAIVNGVPQGWVTGASPVIRLDSKPNGETVLAQWRTPGGTATDLGTFTNTFPDRCDDFDVAFTGSCEGFTVSVKNNHGADVYLRLFVPGSPDFHAAWLVDGATFTGGPFPMTVGQTLYVEVTFGAGGYIDAVDSREYVQEGDCGGEPEYPTTVENTCDGVKVTVTNDSDKSLLVKVRHGVEPLGEFVVPASETVALEIEAEDGAQIEVAGGDLKLKTHVVEHKDCPTPPTGPALPTTGVDVTKIVLAGLGVLLAGAAVLFVLHLRRRKLTQQ